MKKLIKIMIAFITVMLLSLSSLTVFAEEETQVAEAGERMPTTLKIDTQHTFAGMACSYSEGYRPKVSKNNVRVVLPLIADGEIRDNVVTAKASIDFSEESPFVCKNYEKTVSLGNNVAVGNIPVSSFLIVFDLELASTRKNGSYPVAISVNAVDKNGGAVTFESTVYVSITDGKSAESENEGNAAATALKIDTQNTYAGMDCSYSQGYRPVVSDNSARIVIPLVSDGEIKDNRITARAGIDFSAESPFVCNNYEKTVFLESNVTTGGAAVSGYLVAFDLQLNETCKNGNYPVTVSVNALDKRNNAVSFEATVYVVISDGSGADEKTLKMQFDEPEIPSEVTVSDMIEAPFRVINLSKCKVYNVRASMSGDGLVCRSTAFIGDMEAGTSADSSFSISVTSLSGDTLYGITDGTVIYTYEDENGKEYSEEKTFSTSIQSPFFEYTDEVQDNPKQWWGIMLAVALVLIAVIAVSLGLFLKKRGKI